MLLSVPHISLLKLLFWVESQELEGALSPLTLRAHFQKHFLCGMSLMATKLSAI